MNNEDQAKVVPRLQLMHKVYQLWHDVDSSTPPLGLVKTLNSCYRISVQNVRDRLHAANLWLEGRCGTAHDPTSPNMSSCVCQRPYIVCVMF